MFDKNPFHNALRQAQTAQQYRVSADACIQQGRALADRVYATLGRAPGLETEVTRMAREHVDQLSGGDLWVKRLVAQGFVQRAREIGAMQ